ncbi:MAG: PulJ/GspJ family protein [Opitutales bacterium]
MNSRSPSQRAFTLAEVVLALSVTGLILVAAASLLTDFSTLWLKQGDDQAFEAHADGLQFFLADLLERQPHHYVPAGSAVETTGNPTAANETTPRPGSTASAGSDLAWARPPGVSRYVDPMLRLALPEDLGPILEGSGPVGRQTGYLTVDPDHGLVLVWSQALLPVESEDDLFSRILSPFVTDWAFWYHDPAFDAWDRETEPRPDPENTDSLQLPAFVTLSLEHQGQTRTLRLPLPVQTADVLQY